MVTKARSPNYPAFGLGKAIDLIRKVHTSIHHHKAPAAVVLKAIGYSSMSGRALSSISALKKFGLLEEIGKEFKVSKDAMLILFEPADSPAKSAALERAAMAPDLFSKLRSEFPGQMPSDDLLRSYLLQHGFLVTTVNQAIRAYRDTISMLAGGSQGYNSGSDSDDPLDDADLGNGEDPQIEIGDLVQWESGGVLRMEKPQKVRAIQDGWAFVDGSETGIPMEELILEKKGETPAQPPAAPPKLPLPIAETKTAAGEKEWLRGPLSKAASYRLIVSGEVGSKEIGKLIKLLEAQKLVLDDEDEELA
jgi:hypothetical protein